MSSSIEDNMSPGPEHGAGDVDLQDDEFEYLGIIPEGQGDQTDATVIVGGKYCKGNHIHVVVSILKAVHVAELPFFFHCYAYERVKCWHVEVCNSTYIFFPLQGAGFLSRLYMMSPYLLILIDGDVVFQGKRSKWKYWTQNIIHTPKF